MIGLNKVPFRPKLDYYHVEWLLGERRLEEKKIENSMVFNLVRKLTDKAFPTYRDKYDKKWGNFYLPLRRGGHFISLPFWIMEYSEQFFVFFQGFTTLNIKKGDEEIEEEYKTIFEGALRFIHLIKKNKRVLEKTVPYDIRTGKVKGKYIMETVMPKNERKNILEDYDKHLKRELKISQVSLNEYLKVCAVCYRASYGKKTAGLSPFEMYNRWADGRHGGMLDIQDRDSKKAFMRWHEGGRLFGSHPHEIVFSWSRHGIHLYPPDADRPFYLLNVTNYAYARDYIKMVKALIKNKIPFQTRSLNDVLDYLSGNTYFTVNDYSDHMFHYIPSREYKKLYFHNIEWDEIRVPKWK